jgi:hypothetical protein
LETLPLAPLGVICSQCSDVFVIPVPGNNFHCILEAKVGGRLAKNKFPCAEALSTLTEEE